MNYDTAIKTLTQVKEPPPGTTPHALYDAIATAILSMAHCQYLGVTKFELRQGQGVGCRASNRFSFLFFFAGDHAHPLFPPFSPLFPLF
ncbi:hypothetical protein ES703_84406 [subsurface metagenome]